MVHLQSISSKEPVRLACSAGKIAFGLISTSDIGNLCIRASRMSNEFRTIDITVSWDTRVIPLSKNMERVASVGTTPLESLYKFKKPIVHTMSKVRRPSLSKSVQLFTLKKWSTSLWKKCFTDFRIDTGSMINTIVSMYLPQNRKLESRKSYMIMELQ